MSVHGINGPGMGVLCSLGATERQLRHLAFLGLDVGEGEPSRRHGEVMWQLRMDEDGFDFSRHRKRLEATITKGLLDLSIENAEAISAHLSHEDDERLFDEVTLALLESLGVSPAWGALVANLFDDVEIRIDARRNGRADIGITPCGPCPAYVPTRLWLGDATYHNGGEVRPGGQIPELVAISAAGRPLRDLVAHPVLDALDLTIQEIERGHIQTEGFRSRDFACASQPTIR